MKDGGMAPADAEAVIDTLFKYPRFFVDHMMGACYCVYAARPAGRSIGLDWIGLDLVGLVGGARVGDNPCYSRPCNTRTDFPPPLPSQQK